MAAISWDIEPWALLLFALLYFFDNSGIFALMLPPVLVHEAGHAIVLRLGGLRLRRLRLGIFGLEMDYWGKLSGIHGWAAIGAGPAAGILYGLVCLGLGAEFWRLSGGLSLLLSAFNLLPVLPLDGGRLLALAVGNRAGAISRGMSLALAAFGLGLWIWQGWFSLFAMGAWLAWCNFRRV